MRVACWTCAANAAERERIGRRDTCTACGADLHSCRGCRFYDAAAYNACAEPQAERVLDKERGNFCDWFAPRTAANATPAARTVAGGGDARAELDRLFRRR